MSDTVLIVDDSLTVRMDLAEAFEAAGFHPMPCSSATEARRALTENAISVVVLDVLLPDGDGVDILSEIRASPSTAGTTVLMLSTEAEVKDRIRGLQTGADEYVGKPYDASYVVAKARELLSAQRNGPPADDATILVIDDSITFREELRHAFGKAGYAVLTASNGEDGLRLAADRRPSAVVVDGQLPGIDGATVIRRLRLDAALRSIPCLLLTGSEELDVELRALDAGADGFIRKEEDIEVILARVAATLRRAAVRPSDGTASVLGPKKILAVDDSPTYLHEIAGALGGEGYDVVLARSGEEALELLSIQSVDCVLLDLLMPGLSGHETCRRIKAAPVVRDTPLIMLTALDDRAAMLEGLGAGADDYIPKSGDFEVLKARVRAQLRRKQFEDETRKVREDLMRSEREAAEARAAQQLAATREALIEQLERKNRELEAFSYSVSHDLRAPLRAIDGFSGALLEEYVDRLDENGQHYVRRVRASVQRMQELIDALLKLSRVNTADLRRGAVDLAGMARRIVLELQQRDTDRRVDVRIDGDLVVHGDGPLMQVLLENLLGNAWKFTSKVEPARIALAREDSDEGPVYFVQDNGAGFDMAHAERLFGAFTRLHLESEFPGTGIGLATVQRVVDRHGGRVWAEGAVGVGATFYFTVPPASSP